MSARNANLFLFLLDRLLTIRMTYNDIKSNEETRKASTVLGKRALIYEIIFIVLVGGGAALVTVGLSILETIAFFWGIFVVILGGALMLTSIIYFILALNCAIKQLCLNRRAIGWITLFLPFAAVAAAVVCILILAV